MPCSTINNIEKRKKNLFRLAAVIFRINIPYKCVLAVTIVAQTHRKCIENHYVWHSFPSASCQIKLFRCCACTLRHCHRHRCPLFTYQFICLSTLCDSTIGVDFTQSSIVLRSTYSVHDVYGSLLHVQIFCRMNRMT